MRFISMPVRRSIVTVSALVAALLLFSSTARATTYYWVSTYLSFDTSGCSYFPSGGNAYHVMSYGYGSSMGSGLCNAIAPYDGTTAYSYCGTAQPTLVTAVVVYATSSSFFTAATGTAQNWGTTSTATLSPAYNSAGTACSGSHAYAYAIGNNNP